MPSDMTSRTCRTIGVLLLLVMLIHSPLHTTDFCDIESRLHCSTSNVEEIVCIPDPIHQEPSASFQQAMFGVDTEEYSIGNWLWNRTYGGLAQDTGSSVVTCIDGGFAVIGSTRNFGAGDSDVWLVRTDNMGQVLWNKTFGGIEGDVGRGLVRCSDGGFALIAETYSFGAGQWDFWLIRTDDDGNHLWNRTYGGSLRDHGFSVLERSDGGFILMGMTTSYGGPDKDLWLVGTDNLGNHQWDHTYGGNQIDEGISMVQCRDGGIVIVGYSDELGGRDVWLVRTDEEGNYLWERRLNVGKFERGEDILECNDGGFLITGTIEDPSTRATDMWLIRTNSTGHHQWNRIVGGIGNDYGYAVVEHGDGGFAVAGITNSSGAGNQDAWFVLANSTGHHIWNQTCGGSDYDYIVSMIETSLGGFAIVGYTYSFGMGDTDMWMMLMPQLTWGEPATSQVAEFGLDFHYDLNATSHAGIGSWWLNDSIHFAVDNEGVITNAGHLGPVGTTHGLEVSVNDTVGNDLTTVFNVTVGPDISPPSWLEQPTDQIVEFGEGFVYDVNATDPSGLSQWWVDDTVRFTIDWAGRIRSIEPLSLGPYGLTIYVSDVYDHVRSAQFTVWVMDTLPPSWTASPTDQILQHGERLSYQLAAWDLSGISSWTINDTLRFEVSTTGLLTNTTTLTSGVYGLIVTASDPHGNVVAATFTITVQAEYEPHGPSLIEPLVLSGIVAGSFIVGVVFWMFLSPILKRRKKPE
ncbi:MAG: hypothetical protein ACFFH0_05580 [Promethearchaeota archaeon]